MIMPKDPIYKLRACSGCGKDFEGSLFSGRAKYCPGCLKEAIKRQDRNKTRSILTRFKRLKENATRREIECTLSYEQYFSLVCENKCSYCCSALPKCGSGVDRKHFEIGYVSGNCVPCCALCNDRKGKLELCGFSYERVLQLLTELNSGL
jgi:hypothetical protein